MFLISLIPRNLFGAYRTPARQDQIKSPKFNASVPIQLSTENKKSLRFGDRFDTASVNTAPPGVTSSPLPYAGASLKFGDDSSGAQGGPGSTSAISAPTPPPPPPPAQSQSNEQGSANQSY